MLGNLFMRFLSSANIFQNKLFENIFQEHYLGVKSFGPDQDRCYFGPDPGPNRLQRLSADTQ